MNCTKCGGAMAETMLFTGVVYDCRFCTTESFCGVPEKESQWLTKAEALAAFPAAQEFERKWFGGNGTRWSRWSRWELITMEELSDKGRILGNGNVCLGWRPAKGAK